MSSKATSGSKAAAKKSTPAAVKLYLVLYNALSAAGWGYILALLVVHLFNLDGQSHVTPTQNVSLTKLPAWLQPVVLRAATSYSRIGEKTTLVQSFAVLEVVHAILGWVRSPVVTTTMQVSSRLFLVWGITQQFPETHFNPIYASMVLAWSLTEVIRYTFYALNLVGPTPKLLLWLRYTTFYVLYPLGASSEAFLILATLPQTIFPAYFYSIPKKSDWTLTEYARSILFTIWWPGLYAMYTYMIGQRKKVLGSGPSRSKGLKKTQ